MCTIFYEAILFPKFFTQNVFGAKISLGILFFTHIIIFFNNNYLTQNLGAVETKTEHHYRETFGDQKLRFDGPVINN